MLLVLLQRVQRIWTKMPSLYNRFVTCNSFSNAELHLTAGRLNCWHLPHGSAPKSSCSPPALSFPITPRLAAPPGHLLLPGSTPRGTSRTRTFPGWCTGIPAVPTQASILSHPGTSPAKHVELNRRFDCGKCSAPLGLRQLPHWGG